MFILFSFLIQNTITKFCMLDSKLRDVNLAVSLEG